jgi:hypothetical protein
MSAGLMQAAGEKDIFKSGHCNPSKAFSDCQFAISLKISIDKYVSSSMKG